MRIYGLFCLVLFTALIFLIPATESFSQHYRFIEFSGYQWLVRQTEKPAGPGPNLFSAKNVSLNDTLKLSVTIKDGAWSCGQVNVTKSLGYGRYRFVISGKAAALDPNIVFGLFTWDNSASHRHNREMDIEFSRWGKPDGPNAQFIVQPGHPGKNCVNNCSHFFVSGGQEFLTNYIFWQPGLVEFKTYQDRHHTEAPENALIHKWQKTGIGVPSPGQERIQINFWLLRGLPPLNGQQAEIIVHDFTFRPF